MTRSVTYRTSFGLIQPEVDPKLALGVWSGDTWVQVIFHFLLSLAFEVVLVCTFAVSVERKRFQQVWIVRIPILVKTFWVVQPGVLVSLAVAAE